LCVLVRSPYLARSLQNTGAAKMPTPKSFDEEHTA
jgi:hypothetical protein